MIIWVANVSKFLMSRPLNLPNHRRRRASWRDKTVYWRSEDQLCEDQLSEDQLSEDQLCEDQLSEDQLSEDQFYEDQLCEDQFYEDQLWLMMSQLHVFVSLDSMWCDFITIRQKWMCVEHEGWFILNMYSITNM